MRTLLVLSLFGLIAPPAARADETGSVKGTVAIDGKPRELVVFVEKVPGKKAKPGKPLKITQKDLRFDPDVLVVRAGESVDFPNEDKVFHNAFSLTPGNDFDLGLYRGGASKATTFSTPGEVDVFCNIHPDMAAKVLVLQNDFFTRPDAKGAYRIAGLPAGKYTLIAWSPDHVVEKEELVVTAGQEASVDFKLTPRAGTTAHLNKNGEQYGRYK